jgi:hypothetical protein
VVRKIEGAKLLLHRISGDFHRLLRYYVDHSARLKPAEHHCRGSLEYFHIFQVCDVDAAMANPTCGALAIMQDHIGFKPAQAKAS